RAVDVLERPAARREQHRLAERRHVAEEGDVQEVPGGELEGGDVELGTEVGARRIERGNDEPEAELPGVPLELDPLLAAEFERLAVLAVGRAEAVLVVVRGVVEGTGEERPVVALLQLDRVDPALLGGMDERLRLLELSLVVVTDLGEFVAGASA